MVKQMAGSYCDKTSLNRLSRMSLGVSLVRSLCDGSGQSLIVFALTLPAQLLLLTRIFTFGIGTNNYLLLTEAVSVGARTVAVSRQNTVDTPNVNYRR
jgi:Flp pilus assembly protein TadG